MLTEAIKQEIRDGLARIAASMPNFKPRAGQRIMIAAVANAFGKASTEKPEACPVPAGASFVCINGGTGIGKSLAYAVPGAIIARHTGKKLILSSSTVTLQNQLLQKDLPAFLGAIGLSSMKVELAKGRSRYACTYKLHQAVSSMQQMAIFGDEEDTHLSRSESSGQKIARYEQLLEDFNSRKWNGDRDALEGIDDALWKGITTDRHGCLGRQCSFHRNCAQMDARSRMKTADILVANHDLVLSDLAAGGGLILPKPEDSLYIFDEAHHLPEKAVGSFASNHLLDGSAKSLERLEQFISSVRTGLPASLLTLTTQVAAESRVAREGLEDAHAFFASLQQLVPTHEKPQPTLEFECSMIPDEFVSVGHNILGACQKLLTLLSEVSAGISETLSSENVSRSLLERHLAELGEFTGRIENVRNTWILFLDEPTLESPPIAKWVTTVLTKRNTLDFQVSASPVIATQYLKEKLWDRAAGAVLCSATLTTLGDFSDFISRAGLQSYPDLQCVDVPSPFNYHLQGVLEIPPMKASPKDSVAHTTEVLATIITEMQNLSASGMLVLFTSKRQMQDVASQLPATLRAQVQVQGDASKAAILANHCARIDRGEASVVFGLESFAEGVDLVGRYCNLLVVTRLPFQAPDNPVLRTLSEWIDRRGGNAFMQISVPDAARKLEQRIGRLIRSESDSGRVLVLDTRLWTTRFGRLILRGLPPFKVFALGKEVAP